MPVTLLTLVSNYRGYGPGHSAIAIDGTAYSFEQAFNTKGSGWLYMSLASYLKKMPAVGSLGSRSGSLPAGGHS